MSENEFANQTYTIKKQAFKLLGAAFRVYDATGRMVLFSQQKALKLKEDFRLYTGEDMQTEVLCIKARSVLDFSGTYDVIDSFRGETVGALRRHGTRSLVRTAWSVLDEYDCEVGRIEEVSAFKAVLRWFAKSLVPQTFNAIVHGQPVGTYTQQFSLVAEKITVDLSCDTGGVFDRRLALAAGILLCAIECRQDA